MTMYLSPCPFCGGAGKLMYKSMCGSIFYRIECEECGVRTEHMSLPLMAEEKWNRRIKNGSCEKKRFYI